MNWRSLTLCVVLLFVIGLAGLTVNVMLRHGVDILVVVSMVVLALFGVGIVGALLHPPEE
jgi:hypothetical protein